MADELLQPFENDPKRAGLFLDFDGTLSHIALVPHEARPVEGVPHLLASLAKKFAIVAIVSGRDAGQLLDWLGSDVEIWGVHGAQTVKDGRVVLSSDADRHHSLMRRVHDEAVERVAALDLEGVLVEDKDVMVGLHFRNAADVAKAQRLLDGVAAELASKYDLIRAGGRLAYELRPPQPFSKKDVILRQSRELGLRAVMFVGDDRVDLPGFDALEELAIDGAAIARVAVASSEAPPELIERADRVLQGPDGVVQFLRELL